MEIFRCFGACLEAEVVAQDVERCGDIVSGDSLVDTIVTDSDEQGARDLAVTAFLVVVHQC